MPPQPPRRLEAFFAIWIPPACREEVLGDLCEEYTGPLQYFFLAARTTPFVIWGRARRVTEAPVLFMQALLVYACYIGAAFNGDAAFLSGPHSLLRAAVPMLVFLFCIVTFDVYSPLATSAVKIADRVVRASATTFLLLALDRLLPWRMNLLGTCATILMVSALRILFRSHPDLQQEAGPAHWLKQTPAPLALARSNRAIITLIVAIAAGGVVGVLIGLKPGVVGAVIVVFSLFLGHRRS